MFIIKLFNKSGSTGCVFFLKNGHITEKGLAYSGFIGPKTTVSVVPTTPQIVDFAIEANTCDKQEVIVQVNISVFFTPDEIVSKLDFTVDVQSGNYLGDWRKILKAIIIERVVRSVLAKVNQIEIANVINSQAIIEERITDDFEKEKLEASGISLATCSITKIEPRDEDVANAIGVTEKQSMLEDADSALHTRRLKAAENERALKLYEATTKLELEKMQGILLAEQAINEETKATTEANSIRIKLEPLKNLSPGELLGASIMEAARSGRLNNLAITSEFLAAIGQK